MCCWLVLCMVKDSLRTLRYLQNNYFFFVPNRCRYFFTVFLFIDLYIEKEIVKRKEEYTNFWNILQEMIRTFSEKKNIY